jgi:exopolysaccharide production protein ExoQ
MNADSTHQHKFRKKILFISERIFIIASFIHYSGGPMLLFLSDAVSEGEDTESIITFPEINLLFSLIYIITFCLLILRWKEVAFVASKNWLSWLLFGVVTASIVWSYSPELTRTRIVALLGTMLFSLYLASRYSIKEQLKMYGWIFGTIIVLCIIFAILLPKYGLMASVHAGAWRGIYNHKNVLGKMMVPIAIVFYLLAKSAQKQRWILWTFFGASVMLILLSRASSPLLNSIVLMSLLLLLPILRWNYLLLIPALLACTSVGLILQSFLANNAEQVVGAFGKNLTLTGRTNFWPLMVDAIAQKPWLGYGFGAFWQGWDGPSAYVWNASTFKAPNGHNGYLDLCLNLGLVGFTIYILLFITSFQKALVYIRQTKTPDAFWPTLLFVYVVLSNLTETSLVLQNSFLWIMELTTFFSLSIPQLNRHQHPVLNNI